MLIEKREAIRLKGTPRLAIAFMVVFIIILVASFVPQVNATIIEWLKIIFPA